ncbi:MAG: spore germination protein [Clostridiales bacterium]|nr:spore germination protein [Clostridiales bacterium]
MKETFGDSADVVLLQIETVREKAMLVFIDGLVNKDLIQRDIINPLKDHSFDGNVTIALRTQFKEIPDLNAVAPEIVNGNAALFYEGSRKAFVSDLKGWAKRGVETPLAESVIRGPKEGFTEDLRTNSALIRRKIRNPKLIFESLTLGRQTQTHLEIVYVEGIVNRDVLEELRRRLSSIDIDAILESGFIEHYIEDNIYSPIPGIGMTQKPDIAAARILDGRVAVLCDGTPHALTIPELFVENLQTSEDIYNRLIFANFTRLLRILGLFIAVMLPGLAVAFITFNQEMLPTVFLIKLISSTEGTPLSSAIEAFLLILMFELLKEAGTRLPMAVGSAITIVGSLIIGEAAVGAGIVSAPMVIIIALTAVCSFIIPNLNEFIIISRLFFLLLGSTLGLIGIGAGIALLISYLVSTKSFGIPILASFSAQDIRDSIFRVPYKYKKFRPTAIAKDNVRRQP